MFSDKKQYSIVDSRDYTLYLNPLFIIKYIYLLLININLKEKLTKQIFHIYYLAILEYIKPKVVITYIDNNSIYLWLAKNYKKSNFIAIQNGIRQKFGNSDYKNICEHDHFYCFGQYDIQKHFELGCKINNAYPVGSYRAGLMPVKDEKIVKKYDICIISSDGRREPNLIKEKGIRDIAFSNRKIDKLLHRYISLKNLNIVIALSTNTKEENNYYRNLFGNGIKMIGKTNSLSTYNLVNDCKLSISFMSTMLLETIGLGNKAISIHFDDTDLYFDYPKEIKYVYRDFKSFSKYMDTLLNMSDSDYENKIKNIKKYIMNNDKMNPPHMIIKRHINRIINNI